MFASGQKNIKTKTQQNLDESCSKANKRSMSHDQRSKKHRLLSGSKVKKTSITFGFKGQKNIFYDFVLSRPLSKKHGLGHDQKPKKIGFLTLHWSTSH
jgi:hypothetical protein